VILVGAIFFENKGMVVWLSKSVVYGKERDKRKVEMPQRFMMGNSSNSVFETPT
jgi:hypothetical protein